MGRWGAARWLALVAVACVAGCDDAATSRAVPDVGVSADGGGPGGDAAADDAAAPVDRGPSEDAAAADVGADAALADAALADAAPDAARPDAAADAAGLDAGADAAPPDAATDATLLDAALPDGAPDAALRDADLADLGSDAAAADAAAADAAAADAAAADAAAVDAAGPDAAPPPPNPAPACAARAPLLLYDRLVLVDGAGLHLAPADPAAPPDPLQVAAWAPGFAPLSPVGAAGTPAGASVLVALQGPAGCRLRAFDADGGPLWSVDPPDATQCARPAVAGDRVLLPVATPAGGRLQVRDRATGALLGEGPLPAAPGGAPAYVGADDRLQNGGSHWVVPVDGAVVVVAGADEDPPRPVVVHAAVVAGTPTELAVVDGRKGAVAVRSAPAVEGYGDRLVRLTFAPGPDGPQVAASAHIEAPAPIHAPPVVVDDCDGQVANGGSHWWCPGGLVAAGGDGFVGGWSLDDGAPRGVVALPETLRSTGLTVGADDRLFNGGSHWRGGEAGSWRLDEIDLTAPEPSALPLAGDVGLAGTCLASPIIDSDGLLASALTADAAEPTPLRLGTLAGGLAVGWARAGGDNLAGGAPVAPDAPCPGGVAPLYARPFEVGAEVEVEVGAAFPDGGRVLAGGLRDGDGDGDDAAWVARVSPGGRVLWSRTYAGQPGQSESVRAVVVDGGEVVALHDRTVAPDFTSSQIRVLRLDATGEVVRDVLLDDGAQRAVETAIVGVGGGVDVLTRAGDPVGEPRPPAILRLGAGDQIVDTLEIAQPADAFPEALLRRGDGYLVVGSFVPGGDAERDGYAQALDAAGDELWFDVLAGDPGSEIFVDNGAVADNGDVLITASVLDDLGDTTVLVRRYGGLGVSLGTSVVTGLGGKAVGLTFGASGDAFLLGEAFDLVRVTAEGGAGAAVSLLGGRPSLASALLPAPGGGALVSGLVLLEDGITAAPIAARVDPFGRLACRAAGRCVGLPLGACDDLDPCTEDACDAATGLCAASPLPDGAACGDGLVCAAGACQ